MCNPPYRCDAIKDECSVTLHRCTYESMQEAYANADFDYEPDEYYGGDY